MTSPAEPRPGIPVRWGIAALLATAAVVCGVHGGALASLSEEELAKSLKQDRFAATLKIRQRQPLSERETAAMRWRPGQPLPTLGDPAPWFWASGALGVIALLALVPWGQRRDGPRTP